MALTSGTSIGPYQILDLLGAGGMGEVYLARDARLAREVAVKILPSAFAADADRVSRFELEARAAAALSHPNIVAVHDIGHQDATWYVVTERLDGQTLRDRLNAGPVPPRKAVEYARQIAAGLAAAHGKGIVHRDLKPENIFITADDRVKILDFGLAKLTDQSGTAMTLPGSAPGLVLGTAGYMSPEQAAGKVADHRSDIFSFGVVLFEMIAGRRAFSRPTPAQTMAAIIDDDPPETGTPASPLAARALAIARRCLDKSPGGRFQSAADLALMLEHELTDSGSAAAPIRSKTSNGRIAIAIAAALIIGGPVIGLLLLRPSTPPAPAMPIAFTISLPAGEQLAGNHPVAISRDGRRIVYTALRDGRQQLFMRTLEQDEGIAIPGTDGASYPVFSPDGESLAFVADGLLKRTPIGGGVSTTLASAPTPRGLDWGADGRLIFSPDAESGLFAVSASGGPAQRLTELQPENGDTNHRWPVVLPDGSGVIYTIQGRSRTEMQISGLSYKTGALTAVGVAGTPIQYLESGHLVWVAVNGETFAAPFDVAQLKVTGAAIPLAERPAIASVPGDMALVVSMSGTMATIPIKERKRSMVMVERDGTIRPMAAPPRHYYSVATSPDGRRVAAVVQNGVAEWDIWLFDAAGKIPPSRVTVSGFNMFPYWGDNSTLLYSAFEDATWKLVSQNVTRNDPAQVLYSGVPREPMLLGWAPPDRSLAYTISMPRQIGYAVSGDGPPRTIIPMPPGRFRRALHGFSPDGRWVAYMSDQSGQFEVYVMSFPGGETTHQVSLNGGVFPLWSKDGRQLFFQRDGAPGEIMRVTVNADGTTGTPAPFVTGEYVVESTRVYDALPDGALLMLKEDPSRPNTHLDVVVNWPVLRGLTKN